MGESFGGGGGSANVGVNFNLEKSSSKWVNEQTSLTAGGTVNIDAADKTTLKGAVIASDSADLTLATGSFEYSNIKDSDRSYNVGGGANIGGNGTGLPSNYSLNGNYGFTDSRQTNFATVGEGTIIVRDGTSIGTPGTYDGLNRDVTLAQYNTKEGGLTGGFTVDDTTVDFVTSPIDTVVDTTNKVVDGVIAAKDTIVDTSERTVNCYKSMDQGDGLTWENQDERITRLENELLFNDDVEYAEGYNSENLALATDPEKMGQHSAELYNTIGEVYDEFQEDDSDMQATIDKYKEIEETYSEKAQENWKLLYPEGGSECVQYDRTKNSKERNIIYKELLKYNSIAQEAGDRYSNLSLIHDYIIDTPRDQFIKETTSELCNVESNWEYGYITKKEDRDFKEFYSDELNRGRIGSVKDGKANAYYGTGGYEWAQKYGLDLDGSLRNNVGTDKKAVYQPVDEKKAKEFLDNNTEGVAIIHKETYTPGQPTHWSPIIRDENGTWIDYDHNEKEKVPADYSKIYKITQEKIPEEKKVKGKD